MSVMELQRQMAALRPLMGAAPVLIIKNDNRGEPVGASAFGRLDAGSTFVWKAISELDRFATRIPMIDRVEVQGDLAKFDLKFGVSLLSVKFSFQTQIQAVEGQSLTLTYRSGEPRDIEMCYLIEPDGPDSSFLGVQIRFDAHSIGWLARFFLKRHPEILYGVHSGSALSLFDSIRKLASPG